MVPDLVGLFDAKVANAATRQRNMNIQSPHVDLYSAFYKLKLCTIEYMWVIFSNFWQILVSNYPNYVRRYRKCLSKNCWVCPCFAKAVTCICFGQERLHKAISSYRIAWDVARFLVCEVFEVKSPTSCNIYFGAAAVVYGQQGQLLSPAPTIWLPNLVLWRFFQAYLLLATASKAPWRHCDCSRFWWVWNSDIFSGAYCASCQYLPMLELSRSGRHCCGISLLQNRDGDCRCLTFDVSVAQVWRGWGICLTKNV